MRRFFAALMLCMLVAYGAVAEEAPKYVFLFIGDGMGVNHAAAAAYARQAAGGGSYRGESFLTFDQIGLMTTHSLTGSMTDSAASATAMASGHKTHNGALNQNPQTGEAYAPITYGLDAKGYGIGLITSVSIDHATPAAFFASVPSRYDYLDIAAQGFESGIIDFWAGGGFSAYLLEGGKQHVEALMDAYDYALADTPSSIEALTADDLPAVVLAPSDISNPYMAAELDRRRLEKYGTVTVSLAQLMDKAIKTLSAQGPFFIMCESGQIDTASANQDVAGMIHEVYALEDAVISAMRFAQEHPDETLIVVLADHETGGLRIKNDADWQAVTLQKASYTRFSRITSQLYKENADAAAFLEAIDHYFSLSDGKGLSEAEESLLLAAYVDGKDRSALSDDALEFYRGLEPASYAACLVMQSRMRVQFETENHTGQPVAVYAQGVGSERFAGVYDNTDIHAKLTEIMRLD